MPPPIAEIVLDQALERPLDYIIPPEFSQLEVGARVEVPLRNGVAQGTILSFKERSLFPDLKPVLKILSEGPLISEQLFKLAHLVSRYYCAPLNKVLKMILPPSIRKLKHPTQYFVKPLLSPHLLAETCLRLRRSHPARARVIDLLLAHPKGLFLTQIIEKGISAGPVKALAQENLIAVQEVRVDGTTSFRHAVFPTKAKMLNVEQQRALDRISDSFHSFQPHLLFGVTGSGKTEVYLQAMEKALSLGMGIIYLVPEIALTAQTIERFEGRFGQESIAVLHYRLTDRQKFDTWHRIQRGEAKIAIGARSAIFSPLPNLGLIIVDEEHESSYKQSDDTPKYHARDVALMRGKLASCPVVLGSATPSIESYTHALSGKYLLSTLNNRADVAKLPQITIVDMEREYVKAKGFTLFSDLLLKGIRERLNRGEQTLLFLNRRGYHTSALCPLCSYVIKCPGCDLSLTYHLGENRLACHLCDYQIETPRECPSCKESGPLKFKGAGTELVERTLHALFPEVRTLRLDADTARHKGSHERVFSQFRSGKADVLIGTQMVAKGLHFPQVTLVGVIAIDGSLHIPDFRASEIVFQLLIQVAGRAGRGELPGEVVIQTRLPDHPLIQQASSQDFSTFYLDEIESRRLFRFPPFVRLIKCTVAAEELDMCEKAAKQIRERLVELLPAECEILAVIPCGYAKINKKHRLQCLIKTTQIRLVLPHLEKVRELWRDKKGIHLAIDVDPLTTFF